MATTQMSDENKKKALDLALSGIEKQFGKGAIMKLGTDQKQKVPAISTGSLGIDLALGIGGFLIHLFLNQTQESKL